MTQIQDRGLLGLGDLRLDEPSVPHPIAERPAHESPAPESIIREPAEPAVRPAVPAVAAVTILVPTRNEAGNVLELLRQIDQGVGELPVEVLFVDDSDDETPDVIGLGAADSPRAVHLLHRLPELRSDGLSGAVVAGLRRATSPWVVVMDGDLQHPPDLVPVLLQAAVSAGADLAVASRYTGSGDASGLAGRARSLVSMAATCAARGLFPLRLRRISDPMSGFFVLRRDAVDLGVLRPQGFKILLEIALRGRRLQVVDVPFQFGQRHSGTSKASLREGSAFLRQLLRLRLAPAPTTSRRRDTVRRAVAFAAVGGSGIVVNLALLWALADPAGLHLHYLWAATLATQGSTTWNFVLTDRLVFGRERSGSVLRRFAAFAALNNAALLLRLPVLALLVSGFGVDYLFANCLTLALAFATRFQVADRFIYRRKVPDVTVTDSTHEHAAPDQTTDATGTARLVPDRLLLEAEPTGPVSVKLDPAMAETILSLVVPDQPAGSAAAAECADTPVVEPVKRRPPVNVILDLVGNAEPPVRRGTGYLPYRYNLAGQVTIGSDVALKELEYFRAPQLGKGLDIEIRVGDVGSGRARTRAQLSRTAGPMSLRFEEHLGRFGANFEVKLADRIDVTVTPLLARSPHVLYTNILEALLRFILVRQGRMLLHSACVQLDGRGIMLSAKTDTGKTGTILRLLREQDAQFLSDDMTILEPDGTARCFPKPLTISHHTLRAVDPGDLSAREWRKLKLQSRLHSKEGRQWGMVLGELNVPLMTLNALTQMLVPPPKYLVDRLVPTDIVGSVHVQDLFIIERGSPGLTDVDSRTALRELIDNTDDAYGFPPFRYFAPALVLGRDDYDTLRDKELDILTSAMRDIRVRRLASDNFTWADDIPALLQQEAATLRQVDRVS